MGATDMELLKQLDAKAETLSRQHGVQQRLRQAQLVLAVFGSLGIERPDLKIEQVEAVLASQRE